MFSLFSPTDSLLVSSLTEHPKTDAISGSGKIFKELLHHLEDSHELEIPGGHIELPRISFELFGYVIDLSITRHVVFLWISAVIILIVMIIAARKNIRTLVPRNIGNLIDVFVVFIRDEIVIPNMGKEGIKYLPYLLTTFFFILTMNLIGLLPYGATATSNVSVTGGLAVIAFFMIQYSAIRANGIGHYIAHLTGGVHWLLWPIMIPIEILGLFTKAFALCIRLWANMTGGHIVIVSLIGLIFIFGSYILAPIPVVFTLGIFFLEIFVAFLQAYIFTMLTSVFMGLGMQSNNSKQAEVHH